jgi:hypothetical protein
MTHEPLSDEELSELTDLCGFPGNVELYGPTLDRLIAEVRAGRTERARDATTIAAHTELTSAVFDALDCLDREYRRPISDADDVVTMYQEKVMPAMREFRFHFPKKGPTP